ncbi:MAG: hypothetical protein AB8H80_22590 [Planctomycetota bacterium]
MAGKAKSKAKRNELGARLALLGYAFWVIAWFVPAYASPLESLGNVPKAASSWRSPFGAMPESVIKAASAEPKWLPGWRACLIGWRMLTDSPSGSSFPWAKVGSKIRDMPSREDAGRNRRIAGSSCLTNLGMLAALLMLLTKSRVRLAGLALLLCTGLNASWIYLPGGNPFEFLRVGYFLWLLSFPLAGIGLMIRAPK